MDKEYRRDRIGCFRWTFVGNLLRCGGNEHLRVERSGGYATDGSFMLDALAIDFAGSRSRGFAFLDIAEMACDSFIGFCIGFGVFSKTQLGALARVGFHARCVC
jgi:hypothetical protein